MSAITFFSCAHGQDKARPAIAEPIAERDVAMVDALLRHSSLTEDEMADYSEMRAKLNTRTLTPKQRVRVEKHYNTLFEGDERPAALGRRTKVPSEPMAWPEHIYGRKALAPPHREFGRR